MKIIKPRLHQVRNQTILTIILSLDINHGKSFGNLLGMPRVCSSLTRGCPVRWIPPVVSYQVQHWYFATWSTELPCKLEKSTGPVTDVLYHSFLWQRSTEASWSFRTSHQLTQQYSRCQLSMSLFLPCL